MADEGLIVVDRFKVMLQAYRPVHPASCDCPACTLWSRVWAAFCTIEADYTPPLQPLPKSDPGVVGEHLRKHQCRSVAVLTALVAAVR